MKSTLFDIRSQRKRIFKGFPSQALIVFSILIILGGSYLFFSVAREVRQNTINELNKRQLMHARQAAKGIEYFMEHHANLLDSLSAVDSIAAANSEGKRLMHEILQKNAGSIKAISRVNASGRILHTVPFDPNAIGSDISSQDHIQEILRTHKLVISDVFTAVQGYQAIAMHAPVFRNNTFDGTIALLLPFDEITRKYLSDIVIGKTGYAWVISAKGTELYCPVPGHVGRSVFETCKEFPTILKMAEEMVHGKEGITTYEFDQIGTERTDITRKHAVFMPVKIGATFWSVVVATPESEILADLRGARNKLIYIILLLLGAGIIFSYYFVKAVTIINEERRRKEAEKALELAQSSIEATSDGVYWYDNEGRFLNVNDAACLSLGYTKEELLGMSVFDIDPDISPAAFQSRIGGRERQSRRHESRHRKKTGNIFPVEITSSSLQQGDEICHVSFVRDISERKAIEENLRSSMEKFEKIFRSSPDVITITSVKGEHLAEVNKNFEIITGYTREEALGKMPAELNIWVDPLKQEEFKRMLREKGAVANWEAEFRIKSGEIRSCLVTAEIIEFSGERCVMTLFRNIDELKRLTNQLLQSQKMDAIGQLAGGVAHDFNNILTAIIGYGEIMKMKMDKDGPCQNYIDNILSAADRAANLTRSLLAFGRKQVINLRTINMKELIENIASLIRRLIGEDIELKLILPDEDIYVRGDMGQIEQIVMNLATNGRDAMPKGGTLSIGVSHGPLPGDLIKSSSTDNSETWAVLTVEDTGYGMDKETIKNIYEPFFTTKEQGKGTGLGLSMVYGIVMQHKGYIDVVSTPGRGSVFTIYLPVSEPQVSLAEKEEKFLPVKGRETILLAEDDAGIVTLMKESFEESGYRVITARDGEKALAAFEEHKDDIDIVVMDVIMPKMNGKEVYEQIKEQKPDIKILFISGYPGEILQKRGFVEEGITLLQKPILPHDLLQHVRIMLGDKVEKE